MKEFPGSHTPGPKSRPLDVDQVRRAAFGRWPDVLIVLGIPAASLTKKGKPCPCCGGTDRFSFIDRGLGRFVCRSLDRQGGDGFTLVMHWFDCDFKAAVRAVAGVLGMGAGVGIECTPAPPATPEPTKRDNRAAISRLWAEARPIQPGDPVARYLANRGLDLPAYPTALRHHPALDYWTEMGGKPVKFSTTPAMLAKVTSPVGEVVALHRTYLGLDGRKASLTHPATGEPLGVKKLLTAHEGAMRGAAVRLHEPEVGALAVAEGIETALAVRLGSGLPCWAAVSSWGMENAALPEAVTDVHIMADNDANGAGCRAAEVLARRLIAESRRVRVHIPSRPGTDWLDIWEENNEQGAA